MSGIEVKSGREVDGNLQHVKSGTLTGLAIRTTDGKKVLVPTRKSPWIVLPVLIGFVAVLWLAVACGDGVAEFRDFEEEPCEASLSPKEGSMTTTTENTGNTAERIHEVRLKYDPLFWRKPNVFAVGEGILQDENGDWDWTGPRGIVLRVTEKVDQSTLPPEDRIPDCLEGVPVQILESPGGPGLFLLPTEETNGRD